jgi:hypothetical protein
MQSPAQDFTALGLTFESWMILCGLVVIVCIAVLATRLYLSAKMLETVGVG